MAPASFPALDLVRLSALMARDLTALVHLVEAAGEWTPAHHVSRLHPGRRGAEEVLLLTLVVALSFAPG